MPRELPLSAIAVANLRETGVGKFASLKQGADRITRWLLSESSRRIEDASTALTVAPPADLVPA
jgi:hypothetical protein